MRSISLFITILEFLAEFTSDFVIDNGAYCVNDIIARKIVAWSESGCAGWFFVLFAKAKTPLIQLLCLSSIIILPLEQSKNEHHSFCIYWWGIIKLYRYAKKYERVCNVITGNTSFFLEELWRNTRCFCWRVFRKRRENFVRGQTAFGKILRTDFGERYSLLMVWWAKKCYDSVCSAVTL